MLTLEFFSLHVSDFEFEYGYLTINYQLFLTQAIIMVLLCVKRDRGAYICCLHQMFQLCYMWSPGDIDKVTSSSFHQFSPYTVYCFACFFLDIALHKLAITLHFHLCLFQKLMFRGKNFLFLFLHFKKHIHVVHESWLRERITPFPMFFYVKLHYSRFFVLIFSA